MKTLVLVRHGQSQWNLDNRFTGWVDVPLSDVGIEEARAAGQLLKREGFQFDVAFTSVLKRAIKTLWLTLEETDQMWIPVHRSWRINERMYGALQGMDKGETARIHGEEQVKIWRRSYDIPPPAMPVDHEFYPGNDRRYASLAKGELPLGESLKDTVARFLPFWEGSIAPALREGQRVVIAAHGNSLRALVKHLDHVSEKEILELNIPTAEPLLYELDDNLKPLKRGGRYLNEAAAKEKAEAVANQASLKKS